MNILLVNPPFETLEQEGFSVLPPLGLLYIAAVLKQAGHNIKILDCVAHNWRSPTKTEEDGQTVYRFDVQAGYLRNLVADFKPKIIGIANLFATSENECLELAREFKSYDDNIAIVVGGTNATTKPTFFLEDNSVDFVIKGEADHSFNELVEFLDRPHNYSTIKGLCYKNKGEIVISDSPAWVENLDDLPFPAYELLIDGLEPYFQGNFSSFFVEKRILTMITSRGCVQNCYFCPGMNYLGRWRARSPENVIRELEYLKSNFQIKEIAFLDANINLKKDRFISLMDLMLMNNLDLRWSPFGGIYVKTFSEDLIGLMKRSGCHSMNFAVEHGCLKMQQIIGKIVPLEKVKKLVAGCKKHGIWSHAYFVLGLPGETEDSLAECLGYAKDANFDSISFFIGTPLPGSRFFDDVSSKMRLNSEKLRFFSRKVSYSDIKPEILNKTIKKFMINFTTFKLLNELNPRNLFVRLCSLDRRNLGLYAKIAERALKNLFFR